MYGKTTMAVIAGLLLQATASSSTSPPSYVELIVKACPAAELTGQENKPAAVTGFYTEPINQGLSYDNVRSPTKAEREAYFATMHCIDVPIPPEVMSSGEVASDMTLSQCMGHRGYLTAMQYLEMNAAYRSSFPAVGAWICIEHPLPPSGVAGM